jgi:hypothetical protein
MGKGGLQQISGYPMEAAQYPKAEDRELRKVPAASRIVGRNLVRFLLKNTSTYYYKASP